MGTIIFIGIVAILITAAVCFTVLAIRVVENSSENTSARLRDIREQCDRLTERMKMTETLNTNLSSENSQLRRDNEAYRRSDSELKMAITSLKKQLRDLING